MLAVDAIDGVVVASRVVRTRALTSIDRRTATRVS